MATPRYLVLFGLDLPDGKRLEAGATADFSAEQAADLLSAGIVMPTKPLGENSVTAEVAVKVAHANNGAMGVGFDELNSQHEALEVRRAIDMLAAAKSNPERPDGYVLDDDVFDDASEAEPIPAEPTPAPAPTPVASAPAVSVTDKELPRPSRSNFPDKN